MRKYPGFNFFLIVLCLTMLSAHLIGQTNQRNHDVIEMQGQELTNLLGASLDEFRIYRYESITDFWEPVPFQIDEFDGGRNLKTNGNGVLDANDELVFMAKDLGNQAMSNAWPPSLTPGGSREEISFTDPLTGDQGWAYLFQTTDLPLSERRYILLDQENDRIQTQNFTLQFGESGMVESIFLKASAGGDSVDFVDRQKLRIQMKADLGIFGSKTFTVKEQMDETITFVFTSIRVQVYKNSVVYHENPVIRVHRKLLLHIKAYDEEFDLPFLFTCYPSYYEFGVDQYVLPKISFSGINAEIKEARISLDLNENAQGMVFYNPYNTGSDIVVDGTKDSPDQTHLWPGDNWHMFHAQPEYAGTQLTSATLLNITRHSLPVLGSAQKLYYSDSNKTNSSDSGDKLQYGDAGLIVTGSNLAGDTLSYQETTYCLPQNLTPEQGEALFNQSIHPLEPAVVEQRHVHQLTVLAEPANGGTVHVLPGTGELPSGVTVTLEATANAGFRFIRWSTDEADTNTTLSFVIDRDTVITAIFERRQGITLASQPQGLLIKVDGESLVTPVTFEWVPGEEHTICVNSIQSPIAKTNYLFQQWDSGDSYCNGFIVPAADTVLTAIFKAQYKLDVTASEFGKVQIKTSSIGGYYDENTWVVVQANPDPFYAFTNWSGNLEGSAALDSILMDAPKTIQAHFGNVPPVVMAPDTSFAEDDTLFLAADSLQLWVEDTPATDKPVIRIGDGQFVSVAYDTLTGDHYLTAKTANWNGLDTLFVTVTDPLGATAKDTMLVYVLPIPDPPTTFALQSPPTNTVISAFPDTVIFSWTPATDVDRTDTLTYIFELDTTDQFNSPLHIQLSGIESNSLELPWPESYGDRIYYWRVWVTDNTYTVAGETADFVLALFTNVAETGSFPTTFVMEQNYPNPFNGSTEIEYGLPNDAHIRICVYDNLGRQVAILLNETQRAGYHTVQWQGLNQHNQSVASGMYFIIFNSPGKRIVKKAMYIR